MKINDVLFEFAPGGGGDSGDYLRALASAWYNGTFDSGSLQKGIKSQEDVERLLNRGIVCPDGKTRKLHIDYNSDFDGVEIYSDDYYEHGDESGELDSRTGQPFGPYDHMEFKDEELDEGAAEGLNEFAPDGNDGGEEDALHKYAKMWWAGDEATQMQIERALAKMGWEIGEDEGSYDNGGVFVVRAGDINGRSYQSWPSEELDEGMWDAVKKSFTPDPNWQKRAGQAAGHVAQGAVAGAAHGHPVGHAMADTGVAEGAPVTTTPGSIEPGGAVDNFKQQMANRTEIAYKKGMAEGDRKPEPPEADYGADYQDMVKRVKKLAGLGPLKTQYDPTKRVYRNMPTAVQPKK